MKKVLLFASAIVCTTTFAQDCQEIFISEYVEGSGNDKGLELYNPTPNTVDLSAYRIERFSNGQTTSASGGITTLAGSLAPYSTFVFVNGQTTVQNNGTSPAVTPALQAMADMLDHAYPAPTYMNGNDAIVLYKGANIVDILGKVGDATMTSGYGWGDEFPYDGSVGANWTENHTLIRKASVMHGVTANPDPFIVNIEWDSLPENTWSNLGMHACDCPMLAVNEITNTVSVAIYPNPSTTGNVTVSATENISEIEVINLLGQVVYSEKYADLAKMREVNSTDLLKGMYVVRLKFENNSISQTNLVIR